VTGGAGFIGSHLTNLLLDEGFNVTVLDNLSSGKVDRLNSRVEFYRGDVQNFELSVELTKNVDYVFHLAAMSRSGPSVDAFDECLNSNIIGTYSILEASRTNKVKKFVYSASSTCYGNLKEIQQIDSPIELLNPYGWSKYSGEQLALMYGNLHQLPVVSLRYFNVYGRFQPRTGLYALVLGIFLENWKQGLPLEIHGDGNQRRDFIHVSDVVRCNLLAAKSPVTQVALNVGSGENISIKELADYISSNQIAAPKRVGDAFETLADISETIRLLDWKPKVKFEEGLTKLMARENQL
jgi:UDP-glucose 4-epimerase